MTKIKATQIDDNFANVEISTTDEDLFGYLCEEVKHSGSSHIILDTFFQTQYQWSAKMNKDEVADLFLKIVDYEEIYN